MHLTKIIITNEGHEEIQRLTQIVGLKDDLAIVNERHDKIRVGEVTPSPHVNQDSIISREERSKKSVSKIETRILEYELQKKINNVD